MPSVDKNKEIYYVRVGRTWNVLSLNSKASEQWLF